jgi:DNA-directed RNA polymerase specialized sigma24 family protein
MRRIVVARARARDGAKHTSITPDPNELVLDLDAAIRELRRLDALKSRIIELRFFGRLTYAQTAVALNLSAGVFDRELRLARAWLRHKMKLTIEG